MTTGAFRLSIDLDAELQKITQRQHLNSVHFLVQLVRHALRRNPRAVNVKSTKTQIIMEQDGDVFPEEEWRLLFSILRVEDPRVKQAALTRLEERHGITFLSQALNADFLEIESGDWLIRARRGRFQMRNAHRGQPGYRVRIFRESNGKRQLRQEKAEMLFYCAGAHVPIFFNGQAINRPLELCGQILTLRFSTKEGEGLVGIPREGDLCHLTFFKHGVRVGIKQFPPGRGYLYHGYWDSNLYEYESNYQRSISTGQTHLNQRMKALYASLPQHFSQLENVYKARIKKVLLGLKSDHWHDQFGDLQLFHSCRTTYSLSLRQLLRLKRRFEVIPYGPRKRKDIPANLPRLEPEDIYFLRETLKEPLRLINTRPGKRYPSHFRGKVPAPIPSVELTPELSRLSHALNHRQVDYHFAFTRKARGIVTGQNGVRQVFLEVDHPAVDQALLTMREDPQSLPLIRYQLIAHAG